MARTLSAGMAAHLAGDTHTLATMLRLDLRNGTSLGVTDHDVDLTYDLGDGSLTYSAATGILPSDVVLAAGMDANNFDVTGPISDTITRAMVLGGTFAGARARLFMVNWADLTMGDIRLMAGRVADARVIGPKFTLEVRSPGDAFNQPIGRVLSPYCTYDFGDSDCGVTKTAYPATITAVISAYGFVVDLAGAHPDAFFTVGTAEFLTGGLAGTAPAEVFAYGGTSGIVELYSPLQALPVIGDTLNLFQGCSKLRSGGDLPTCLSYANVARFGGFPDVPGSRNYLKTQVAGMPGV